MLTEKLEEHRLHITSLKQFVCLFGREGESKQDMYCEWNKVFGKLIQ